MDTANLRRRKDSGIWMLDFVFPDHYPVKKLQGYRWRHTTGTSDLKIAREIRDIALADIKRARDEIGVVEDLIRIHSKLCGEAQRYIGATLAKKLGLKQAKAFTLGRLAVEHVAAIRKMTGSMAKTAGTVQKRADVLATVALVAGEHTALEDFNAKAAFETIAKLARGWQSHKAKGLAFCLAWSQQPNRTRLSKNSVKQHFEHLRAAWRWALNNSLTLAPIPDFKDDSKNLVSGEDQRQHKIPSVEDCDRLCNLPMPKNWRDEKTWRYAPMLARYSGMRISEIAQIRGKDIQVMNGILCFALPETGSFKTCESLRAVPIATKIKNVVMKLAQEAGDGLLLDLGSTVSKGERTQHGGPYAKAYGRAAKKVGEYSFHSLRGYANSQMADAGVQDTCRRALLGHRDRDDTQRHYLSAVSERHLAALDTIK